eukprot:10229627-Lingulodinium_polyedra.AAC.1
MATSGLRSIALPGRKARELFAKVRGHSTLEHLAAGEIAERGRTGNLTAHLVADDGVAVFGPA